MLVLIKIRYIFIVIIFLDYLEWCLLGWIRVGSKTFGEMLGAS